MKIMKINFFKTSLFLFGMGSILTACDKNDAVVGGEVNYQVKPTGYSATVASSSSGSGLVIVVGSSNSLNFTSGSLNINQVDFEAENKTVEIEYELKGISNVDLFNMSSILGSVKIPEGTYDEVELKLVLKKSTDNTIPLTLKGTYKNEAGVSTPVEFYFNEDYEIEVEAEDVVINSDSDYLGLINIQLNKLLLNVASNDLGSATKTNNVVIISSTSNVSLYNKFKANLNAFGDCDFED